MMEAPKTMSAARPREKFADPNATATGAPRAYVGLVALETLWFNTGTLCNLACKGCYIESTPRNDRLAYISHAEVREKLDEAQTAHPELQEVGFTGGEPFLNPEIIPMIAAALDRGYRVLVLTNAMKPMQRHTAALLELNEQYPNCLKLRVSLDHYTNTGHESVRGSASWQPTIEGLRWLGDNGIEFAIASRMLWDEPEAALRLGYQGLFDQLNLALNATDPANLVLFPEMDEAAEVPEITESCWGILGKRPDSVMCATSRMVVKRKEADQATVVACTLLPYDPRFDLGASLAQASKSVSLNHPHCAKFCVLGNASCSASPQ